MPTPTVLLLLLGIAATSIVRADSSLRHACLAQALLGPDVWSQVIRIENQARKSPYPRTLHALVFELAGVLWFYCDVDGTQSFSLHRGRLAEEKNNFAPLLRDIEPGFTRWRVLRGFDHRTPAPASAARLPNGCFIESVVALRERMAAGERFEHPRLVSFHVETRNGVLGHTVLAYERAGAVEIFDPSRPSGHFTYGQSLAADPLALARAFGGGDVARAKTLPLDSTEPIFAAATTGRRSPATQIADAARAAEVRQAGRRGV